MNIGGRNTGFDAMVRVVPDAPVLLGTNGMMLNRRRVSSYLPVSGG